MGLAPAVTFLKPSLTMAWARTVAVVVPSPAMSFVLVAASLRSWAPMFSKGSSSSISLAMVTPSLVMVGGPNFLSRTTLRPLGPRVILTASASASIPRLRARRASSLYSSCLAGMFLDEPPLVSVRGDDGQNVGLAQDQQLVLIELEFGTRIFGEQHALALFDIGADAFAGIEHAPGPDGQNFALLGLFFGGIGQHDAACGDLLALERFDDHSITEGAQVETRHAMSLSLRNGLNI